MQKTRLYKVSGKTRMHTTSFEKSSSHRLVSNTSFPNVSSSESEFCCAILRENKPILLRRNKPIGVCVFSCETKEFYAYLAGKIKGHMLLVVNNGHCVFVAARRPRKTTGKHDQGFAV